MKKALLLFFNFSIFASVAQQYIAFPTANAVWRENGVNHSSGIPGTFDHYFYEIKITKDTVINNLTYRDLWLDGYGLAWYNFNGPYPAGVSGDICHGAIREDSLKRIYYYDYWAGAEYLLYDFNLSLGDTLPPTMMCDPDRNVVVAVDSVDISGTYHRRFQIADTANISLPLGYYIEGIGSTMGLTGGQLHKTELPFEIYSWLVCHAFNGTTTLIDGLFISSQYDCDLLNDIKSNNENTMQDLTIFPNPTTGKFILESAGLKIQELDILDITGKKIYSMDIGSDTKQSLDVGFLNSGVYFLKAISTNKIHFHRLLKE